MTTSDLLLDEKELKKIKDMLPKGAEIISITDSDQKDSYKQYDRRAKVVWRLAHKTNVSHLSYQRAR